MRRGGRRLPNWGGYGLPPPRQYPSKVSQKKWPQQQPSTSPHAAGSSQNPIAITTPSPPASGSLKEPAIAAPKGRTAKKKAPTAPPPPLGMHAYGLTQEDFGPEYFDMTEEADNALAQEVIDLTQSNDREEMFFIGNFPINVVGVRYYNGYVTPGEQVLLVREPNNPYDSNAIRVLNVARDQVGHIPRVAASGLAPLMDLRQIELEGTVTGPKGGYEVPIRVDVYSAMASETPQNEIVEKLRRKGVHFSIESTQRRLEATRKRKAEEDRIAAATKRVRPSAAIAMTRKSNRQQVDLAQPFEIIGYNFVGSQRPLMVPPALPMLQPQLQLPTLQNLFQGAQVFNPRDVGPVVEKFGMGEDVLEKMPFAEQPSQLLITLLPYQLQGLHWLLDHESPKLPTKPDELVQFWKMYQNGLYINIASSFVIKNPFLASGGILADDMGLGKTVQMISLIVADMEKNGPRDADTAGTLIVAPLSVMSNWKDQIARHLKADAALTVFTYHGTGRTGKGDLKSWDVVITSYGTLTSEHDAFQKDKSSAIYNLKWRRIILDEAHQIRNPKAKSSLASAQVQAKSKWALTGTPIVNNLKDLYSIVRFLGFCGGLTEIEVFHRFFIRPFTDGSPEGASRLQALMATICLRRKKDMKFVNLGLPELKEYVHKVKFTKEEQEKYNVLMLEAQGLLDRYEKKKGKSSTQTGSPNDQGSSVPSSQWLASSSQLASESQTPSSTQEDPAGSQAANNEYRCLLEMLLRMRQMCNHPLLCGADRVKAIEERIAEISANGMSDEMRGLLQEMLQLAIESQEDCAICLDVLHNPRITTCKHVFGAECINRVIETQHKCPMCRAELKDTTSATLIEPYQEPAPIKEQQYLEDGSALPPASSKIETMVAILQATRATDPTSKTIVFSQWTKYLDLISPHLQLAGLRFCRIDGSMKVHQRDAAIVRLSLPNDDPETVDVMLASLTVASVGLNLVAANQVILADSWWAPAIEDQAVDRVHRLGQKRPTTVWRLVVEDSIEEQVLKIQEAKRQLVGKAFREDEEGDAASGPGKKKARRGKGRETRLADLQILLRGTAGTA